MSDSVNPNSVSFRSADFAFLINPKGDKKDRYVGIRYNIIELPAKGIFSVNQVRDAGHFYDNKPRKLGGKQLLVTTDGREIRMFISDGQACLPVRCPTDEEMETYPKVPLTPYGEWKASYIYN